MEQCQARTGGVCNQVATWKQSVHVGDRQDGRFLYYSYWCDEHAKRVAEHRKQNWVTPATMTQIVREEASV